jgi:hypothetical protein
VDERIIESEERLKEHERRRGLVKNKNNLLLEILIMKKSSI